MSTGRYAVFMVVVAVLLDLCAWSGSDGWVSASGCGGAIGDAWLQDQLARHHYRVDDGHQRTVVVVAETP